MIESVYRPKRKKNGKTVAARLYRGRYRLDGEFLVKDVALDTPDRQVARKRLRDLVIEAQKEKEGLVAPRTQREALEKPMSVHLDDYLADLKVKGRVEKYVRLMRSRIERLICDCSWSTAKNVAAGSFVEWRSQVRDLSPKTLNEYLSAGAGLLNWMVKQGRLPSNPLASISLVETKGRRQIRRAFSDKELSSLINVAGDRKLLYLTAVYTGLRLGELRQLVWGDVRLTSDHPHIQVREGTTKNKKSAIVPLHPRLASRLREARAEGVADVELVFDIRAHSERAFRRDLEAAMIERFDALGRKVDFHALRHTFATLLARQGVPQRLAQHLMRHSDPRLTSMIYTDASQLPSFEVIEKLHWAGEPASENCRKYAQIGSQTLDSPGHVDSRNGGRNGGLNQSQELDFEEVRLFESRTDVEGKLVAGAGFEPAAFRL